MEQISGNDLEQIPIRKENLFRERARLFLKEKGKMHGSRARARDRDRGPKSRTNLYPNAYESFRASVSVTGSGTKRIVLVR